MEDILPTLRTTVRSIGLEWYQNNTTTPDIDFSSGIKAVRDYELRRSVAWTSATRLHQIANFSILLSSENEVAFSKFCHIEGISETKIADDDVSILV